MGDLRASEVRPGGADALDSRGRAPIRPARSSDDLGPVPTPQRHGLERRARVGHAEPGRPYAVASRVTRRMPVTRWRANPCGT